jgi:hypothetical protein
MPWPPGRGPQSPLKRHRRSNLECGRRDLREISLFRGCGAFYSEISSVVAADWTYFQPGLRQGRLLQVLDRFNQFCGMNWFFHQVEMVPGSPRFVD